MPLPLAAAALGTTAALGGAQALGSLVPSRFDRENKAAIEELERRKKAGRLGLRPEERQAMVEQQLSPVRSATELLQNQAEATQAAGGLASGALGSSIRKEAFGAVGEAAQRAAQNVQGASIAERRAEEAELEQRRAVQEGRRRDRATGAISGLSQAAMAAGRLAGSPPETFSVAGLFGGRMPSEATMEDAFERYQIPEQTRQAFRDMGPEQVRLVMDDLFSGNMTPEAEAMGRLILENERRRLQGGGYFF